MATNQSSKKSQKKALRDDFNARVAELTTQIAAVVDLGYELGLAKGAKQVITSRDGKNLGKKELKSLTSEIKRGTKDFTKLFAAALKPARSGVRRRNTGFESPFLVSDAFRAFFSEANLGSSLSVDRHNSTDPYAPKVKGQKRQLIWTVGAAGGRLNDEIALLTNAAYAKEHATALQDAEFGVPGEDVHNITSRAILSALFPIYSIVNNLTDNAMVAVIVNDNGKRRAVNPAEAPGKAVVRQGDLPEEEQNKALLGADAVMTRHLSSTFQRLTARLPSKTASGADRIPFDPNCFTYVQFQSIVSENKVEPSNETERSIVNKEKRTVSETNPQLINASILEELQREQQIASDSLIAVKIQTDRPIKVKKNDQM